MQTTSLSNDAGGSLTVDGPLAAAWSAESLDGASEIALVTVEVDNPAAVARRVRVEHRLDGPLLPPRREGVPERGWSERGYDGVVPAGGRIAVGYASPAALESPPVAVTDEGRARTADGGPEATPAAVVRRLRTARPPADVLPNPTVGGTDHGDPGGRDGIAAAIDDRGTEKASSDAGVADPAAHGSGRRGAAGDSSCEASAISGDPPAGRDQTAASGSPKSLEAWFETVERRIERGERLTGASVPEAATALSAAGGLAAAADLPDRLAVDAAALRRVAERADRLASRAEDVDVPVEALRGLA